MHPGRLFSFLLVLLLPFALHAPSAVAKDLVKLVFIGPLTGGNSANGLGGRNAADLSGERGLGECLSRMSWPFMRNER
jgi:preprotein translocase subunit SecG